MRTLSIVSAYHSKEERLDVNRSPIARQVADHMHDMMFHQPQISNLFSHKIRPDQSSGVLPVWAVRVENSMSQQFNSGLSAQFSNVEIRELRGQNTLHVLRFVGEDQCFTKDIRGES